MAEDRKEIERKRREEANRRRAQHEGRAISYTDDDGCEVTCTAGGHVFYNAADWY